MPTNVLIVGGGWAGLSAAIELSSQYTVTLIEASPQLGGRARTVFFSQKKVDNGQHLMIGAYQHTLSILKKLGTNEKNLTRTPFNLIMNGTDRLSLNFKSLFSPFNSLFGIFNAELLSFKEKYQLIKIYIILSKKKIKTNVDVTVTELLNQLGVSKRLQTIFFKPLCLAALTTHADEASAEIFIHVLKKTFHLNEKHSNYLFINQDLDELFSIPAQKYICKNSNKILTNLRAKELILNHDHSISVRTQKGILNADHIILATPFKTTLKLINKIPLLDSISQALSKIKTEPILTIYLQFNEDVKLPQPMIGLLGTWSQWIFDRRFANQPGLLAVIISGSGPYLKVDNQSLILHVFYELKQNFNLPNQYQSAKVIREKQAVFSCCVGINALRPSNRTPLPNLWLAGDYTATHYPATLESAVLSGINCAQQLL